jgi:ankyrin repeat protein
LHKPLSEKELSLLDFFAGVINSQDTEASTPLHVAMDTDQPTVVIKRLLELKADVNARGEANITPLFSGKRAANARLLVEHKANVNALAEDVNYLFVCGKEAEIEKIQTLVSLGLECNIKSTIDGAVFVPLCLLLRYWCLAIGRPL